MEWSIAIAVLAFALTIYGSYRREVWEWNGGISRRSGTPWVQHSTDSSGAAGFEDSAGNSLWISFTSVLRKGPPDPGA